MDKNPHLPGSADEYITANLGLAHSVAWKFTKRALDNTHIRFDKEDFKSIAYMGLIKAYQRFDPTKFAGDTGEQIKFSSYAIPMIRGEIMRYSRDIGYMIRNGRDETVHIDVDSTDRELSGGEHKTLGDLTQMSYKDTDNIIINDFLAQVGPVLRKVYGLEKLGLNQIEIGKHLGVTQAQISRLSMYLYEEAARYGQEITLGTRYRKQTIRKKVAV